MRKNDLISEIQKVILDEILTEGESFKGLSINDESVVYLTEEGFSEPIGSYNKEERIAVLKGNLNGVTIIIDASDIVLDGCGYRVSGSVELPSIVIAEKREKVTIVNIEVMNNKLGILLTKGNNCTKIENSSIKSNLIGIAGLYGREFTIVKSIFEDNTAGVFFESFVSSSKVNQNTFINNAISVALNRSCSYNEVSENTINNHFSFMSEWDIVIVRGCSFNIIKDNKINLLGKRISVTKDEEAYNLSAVSLLYSDNTMNKITGNFIIYSNNYLDIESTYGTRVDISLISINCSNSNEVSKNTVIISKNTFNVEGAFNEVNLSNIELENENSDTKIIENILSIKKNLVEGLGGGTTVVIENLILREKNCSTLIKNNSLCVVSNLVSVEEEDKSHLVDLRGNIILQKENNSNSIIENEYSLSSNGKAKVRGITLGYKNNSNEISENTMCYLDDTAILLHVENEGNIICRNRIRGTKGYGVVLLGEEDKGNRGNILTGNEIIYSRYIGILFAFNGKGNSISNNFIENNNIAGIFFSNGDNNFNYIFQNSFVGNGENIDLTTNEDNYLYDNIFK